MKPERGLDRIQIPMTVDVRQREMFTTEHKKLWIILSLAIYAFVFLLALLTIDNKIAALVIMIIIFIVLQFVLRYVVMGEMRYMKALKQLEENDHQLGHDLFWDILHVDSVYPYTVQFRNGVYGYYVALEKGSIVGLPEDADYDHHEYIANALKTASEKDMNFVHLDYSEVTSRDSRIPHMRSEVDNTDNTDLQVFVLKQIEYLEWHMEGTVASRDIILFYTREDAVKLLENIKSFSADMVNANYSRASLMNKEEIVDVAKAFLNLNNFDLNIVEEVILQKAARTNFLRLISTVDQNGNFEKHAETRKESMSQREIKKQEKELAKIHKKEQRRLNKLRKKGIEEIDEYEEYEEFDIDDRED